MLCFLTPNQEVSSRSSLFGEIKVLTQMVLLGIDQDNVEDNVEDIHLNVKEGSSIVLVKFTKNLQNDVTKERCCCIQE